MFFIDNSEWVRTDEPGPEDELMPMTLHFDTFEIARTLILGWGNSVEVLTPQALRLSTVDYSRQILTVMNSPIPSLRFAS